jgi:hypothetical protein
MLKGYLILMEVFMKLQLVLVSLFFASSACQNMGNVSATKDDPISSASGSPSANFSFLQNKEISNLRDDGKFKFVEKGEVKRESKISGQFPGPVRFKISEITHLPSGQVTTAFVTFKDEDDGGNTGGWIQDTNGNVIGKINDGTIDLITTQSNGSPQIANFSILQDKQLPDLKDDAKFKFVEKGEVKRVSKIRNQFPSAVRFKVSELTHLPSGTVTTVFATFRDEDDGGNTGGWIEDKEGNVVAQIKDSFIYLI